MELIDSTSDTSMLVFYNNVKDNIAIEEAEEEYEGKR